MTSAKASWSRAARAHVGGVLRPRDRLDQRLGDDQPAEAEPGRQDLARGAGVHDAIGAEALDRADRLPVVAELGVVVVLDDRRAARARPSPRAPPVAPAGGRRRSGTDGRPSRRRHRRGSPASRSTSSPSSSTGTATQRRPAASIAARYSGSVGSSTATSRAPVAARARAVRREALGEPGRDDHVGGVGGRAADPVEIGGEGGPQLRHSVPGAVRQAIARRGLRGRAAGREARRRAGTR